MLNCMVISCMVTEQNNTHHSPPLKENNSGIKHVTNFKKHCQNRGAPQARAQNVIRNELSIE